MKHLHFYLPFLLALPLLSCRQKIDQQPETDEVIKLTELESGSKITMIQGIWAENEEDNAIYLIEKDTLYYVEEMDKPLLYSIVSDTLSIYADPIIKWKILKLDTDSLIIANDILDLPLRLYRR